MKSLYWFFKALIKAFYKIFFRFEVSGHENIPEAGGVRSTLNTIKDLKYS